MQDPGVPFIRVLPVSRGHELFDVAVECWLVLGAACFEYWPLDQRVTWVSTPVSLPHHHYKSFNSTRWSVFFNAKHWRGQSSNHSTTWMLSIERWSTTLKLSICWYCVKYFYYCLACNGNPKILCWSNSLGHRCNELWNTRTIQDGLLHQQRAYNSFPFSLAQARVFNVCFLHQLTTEICRYYECIVFNLWLVSQL